MCHRIKLVNDMRVSTW